MSPPIRVVAMFDRLAQGDVIQPTACLGEFDKVRLADAGDMEPTLIFAADQALGGEAIEGFANRADAGVITPTEKFGAQLLAGPQATGEDIQPHLIIDR